MRTITTSAGTPIELDGDVLAISRDLMRRVALNYSFEDVDREFQALVAQLTEDELRSYLKESLFMSFNRFENERLMELVRKTERTDDTQA
jgi:phage gp29-like protein